MESILFIIQIVVFLYSVILHEIAHGFVAYRFGDDTAKVSGRLSFNPIVHIDLVGSIAVPLVLYFSGTNFPSRMTGGDRAYRWVALAGIITNLCLVLLAIGVLKMANTMALGPNNLGVIFFVNVLIVNLVLALFNSLPMPGFDGFNVLSTFDWFRRFVDRTPLGNPMFMAQYGMIISIVLIFALMPVIGRLFNFVFDILVRTFGL
jgi:Zn-dependent protease